MLLLVSTLFVPPEIKQGRSAATQDHSNMMSRVHQQRTNSCKSIPAGSAFQDYPKTKSEDHEHAKCTLRPLQDLFKYEFCFASLEPHRLDVSELGVRHHCDVSARRVWSP